MGSATGEVVSNNDLIVNKDITVKGTHIKSDVTEAKEIYTNIGQHSLTLGSSANSVAAKVIMNNNLQVNGKIFANDNTNKEVFVKQADGTADYTGDVLIGGTKTIIKGTLQTNLNIIADTDEDKELWTNVTTNKITIGGLSSNTVIGNNLTVNGTSILADANENKEIYTNVSTGKTITIGGSASTIVTGNDLKISGHILTDADENKNIFTGVSQTINVGAASSTVVLGGDLKVTDAIKSVTVTDKNIFPSIDDKVINIGKLGTGKIVMKNTLQVDDDIISNANNVDKNIFTNINTAKNITIGGANTTVITGGHLTVTDNILGGSDEDKTFFADVSSKEISIGSGTSKVIMNSTNHMKVPLGTTAQRIANGVGAIRYNTTDDCLEVCHDNTTWTEVPLLKSADKTTYITAADTPTAINHQLRFFTNSVERMRIEENGRIGLGIAVPTTNIHLKGQVRIEDDIIAGNTTEVDKNLFTDMTTKDIIVGGGSTRVKFNSTNSILLPSGTSAQRVNTEGAIRYNTDLKRVEVCDRLATANPVSFHWNSLQGLIDEDRDTKITVEDDVGTDDDKIKFFTAGTMRMLLDESGKLGIGVAAPLEDFHVGGTARFDSNIVSGTDEAKSIFADILTNEITIGGKGTSPASSSVKFDSTKHIILPTGDDSERSDVEGAFRFNNTTGITPCFEGYDGQKWVSLTGLIDEDRDTYVTVQDETTGDTDTFTFYTQGQQVLKMDQNQKVAIGNHPGNLTENFEVLGTSMTDELKVDTIRDKGGNGITLYTSIIPDSDLQYDLGAPTKRFKDLYVSTSSIWMGSSNKITVSGDGQMKFRKVGTAVPAVVLAQYKVKYNNNSATNADVETDIVSKLTTLTDIANVKSEDYLKYYNEHLFDTVKTFDLNTIYTDDAANFAEEAVTNAWLASKVNVNAIYSGYQFVGIGTEDPDITTRLHVNGKVRVDDNIISGLDEDKSIFADITSKIITIGGKTETKTSTPGTQLGGSIVKMDSTNSMIIPVGKTSQRTITQGAIRYNSETSTFEGCDGANWGSLGGVIDVDKDTYISAQDSATADNDQLKFVTAGVQRMMINNDGKFTIGKDAGHTPETIDIKGSTITIEGTKLEMVGQTDFSNDVVCESKIILSGDLDAPSDIDKSIYPSVTTETITIGGKTATDGSVVKMDSNDSMIIPVGTTSQRTDAVGAIRYNSETSTYEGCDSNDNWGSLGGVIDVDKDTYISAETSANTDNDQLKFVTTGVQRMMINNDGKVTIGKDAGHTAETVDIKGSTVTIEGTKLEMVGPTDFSSAVVCEDTVQIDKTLTSKSGITLTGNLDTSTDEHKRIFTGVTNKTINIGGANSTTSVNEMNIEGNITTNQNENKSVFKGVVGNTITIGGSSTGTPSNNGLIDESSDINGLTANDFIYIYDNVGVLRAKIPISAISNGEASLV